MYLAAYTATVLDRGASADWQRVWAGTMYVTWGLFAVDYAGRLALSRHRWLFVRRHWLDAVVLALPVLRPLILVRFLGRRRVGKPLSLEGQVMAYTGLTVLLLGYVGALSVLSAERDARGASIRSFGDAVWWVCSTLSTTGYGDLVPVTFRGRVVGVVLMTVGVGLIGSVVGVFSSWLVRSFRGRQDGTAGSGG
ncbi:potassium channel family protein [Streptomyces sp. PLAI1-29]|uniref:Potassium channel family protein n=2 Tax=Streptomyces zingiberis TaxID=2053010 RepID=A0ABX1BRQ3_9ACTN|nr:potassium channel family protein [Streptomyces zingiberis]